MGDNQKAEGTVKMTYAIMYSQNDKTVTVFSFHTSTSRRKFIELNENIGVQILAVNENHEHVKRALELSKDFPVNIYL